MQRGRARLIVLAATTSGALLLATGTAAADPGPTGQVDVWPDSTLQYAYAALPAMSGDGRIVVFEAYEQDPSTGEAYNHVYARDRLTGETELVDVGENGQASTTTLVEYSDISADGRYVAFVSGDPLTSPDATGGCDFGELPYDPPPCGQIYLRDLVANTTRLVSKAPVGVPNGNSADPTVSGDGSRVAFGSSASNFGAADANGQWDVYLWEAATDTVSLVSGGPDGSAQAGVAMDPEISDDGGTLVFASSADIAPTNPAPYADIFVRDLATGTTTALLEGPLLRESYMPSVSADGTVVAFMSQETFDPVVDTNNSWDVFVLDRTTGQLVSPSAGAYNGADRPQVSADGNYVLYRPYVAGGGVMVYDRSAGVSEVGSIGTNGLPATGADSGLKSSISGDGRFVAYWTHDSGVSHVWVHDRTGLAETTSGSGSATTDGEGDGATPLDPVEAEVSGSPGEVVITELGASAPAPTGYRVLGQQVSITAAPAAPGQYLTITLIIDGEGIPAGTDPASIELRRNDVALAPCAAADSVGPCLASASTVGDDLVLVAHSPQASVWAAVTPVVIPDKENPTAAIASPLDGARVTRGAALTASYSCADTGGSLLASCTGTVPDGAPLDTSTVGMRTFQVTAVDGAGNQSTAYATYTVVYPLTGFASLAAPPKVNLVEAGKVVPLVFSIGGYDGLGVVSGITSTTVTCPAKARTAEVDDYLSAKAPALSYKASSQRYTAAWATEKRAKGCREVRLTLVDGSSLAALVRFTS